MMRLFSRSGSGLEELPAGAAPAGAAWIDLAEPTGAEAAMLSGLGIDMPSLADMREIEVSSRLYRQGGADYMTVFLPGLTPEGKRRALPVTFILSDDRLVTIRHHAPRPFDSYPGHAATSAAGTGSAHRITLGLIEEIVGRQADLIEGVGEELDAMLARVLADDLPRASTALRDALRGLGLQGELLAQVRLALLSLERALSFHRQIHAQRDETLVDLVDGAQRDIRALVEHCGAVSARITFATDLTLGLISVDQNTTMRIFSIVAVFFLPPTLVASIYGMNFSRMPELDSPWGYPLALLVMVASAVLSYAIFKWRRWL